MRSLSSVLRCLWLFFLLYLFWTPLLSAQEPECDDPPPANAPIPAELLTYCVTHPGTNCDLAINSWDTTTYRSPDIRIGDPFDPMAPSPPEQPRFFFDSSGDRFYTKLYVKLENLGGGPAPASEVTVGFSFKESGNPVDVDNASIPWQTIGTYTMNIPAPASVGALFPAQTHFQQKGVCWHRPAGALCPKQFILRAEINWTAGPDGNTDNNIAYSLYDLSSYERPAQIAFAMDLSGSMDSTIPGIGHKLTVAKQKAMLFTNLVENGDQLGVYGFATGNPDNSTFTSTYIGTDNMSHTETLTHTSEIAEIRDINGNMDRLIISGEIWGQSAHVCTPVGQGLLRARWGFGQLTPPVGAGKAIVLFSDGLQNVPPFVNTPPPYTCGSTSPAVDINATKTFKDEGIEIYSVYFGPEVGWAFDLMNQIKEQTGGDYIYGTATELQLAAAYYAIRGLVDDMVYFEEEGTTSVNGPWKTFEVTFDSVARLATVAVAWPFDEGEICLTVDYRQKGETQWRSTEGSTSTDIIEEPSSFKVFRFMPGPNTTWEFRVRQSSRPTVAVTAQSAAIKYTAAVFSAVEDAHLRPFLDDTEFEAGRPLCIFAEVRSAGHPLFGATVKAVVKVPARSFSSTLRKYSKQFSSAADADTNRVSTMVKELRQLLTQDVGSDELYVYKKVPVIMRDDGMGADRVKNDGIYSGQLSGEETHVAGDYEVTISARVTLPSGRELERIARLATICNVGPADLDKSEVEISVSAPRDDGTRLATVVILPTDSFGNAAFPGSVYKIAVSTVGGTLQGGVVDNLDSSFTQEIVLQPGEGAKIKVAVGGVSLGTYPAGLAAPLFMRHEVSLYAGSAIPHGAFSNNFSSGPSIAFDYAYRFDDYFALRTELCLNWFDDRSDGTERLLNLTPYLQYRRETGRWAPYFEAGLGFYDLENDGSALGFSAGAGLRYSISRHWSLDLNLHGHRAGGGLDLSYSQILGGLIFKF